MDRRIELGNFLRHRRDALRPEDIGLLPGGRRRAPGLRRDEVALLANISTDYYERLEQGRGPHPSSTVLGSLARALRMTSDEREHLYVLAGQSPPPSFRTDSHVDPGLMCVLDALSAATPALVSDDLGTIIAQNPLNVLLLGRYAERPAPENNQVWRWFTDLRCRALFLEHQHEELGRGYVAGLRAGLARHPHDPAADALLAELQAGSAEFRNLWGRHEVAIPRSTRKVMQHPGVGRLELQCDVVISPSTGQAMVLFRPQPGTDAGERMALLRTLGTESFAE
ncbi:helix-turn-helix transcriptional regulator [Streptomyces sp. NPDC006422]|uniref:helix-turn-helix transcriptional regulator n=1 Tax=unclassified Streptomyces TaxID=2593676 RepID=UPI0033A03D0F